MTTLREFAMLQFMNSVTDKVDWHIKVGYRFYPVVPCLTYQNRLIDQQPRNCGEVEKRSSEFR